MMPAIGENGEIIYPKVPEYIPNPETVKKLEDANKITYCDKSIYQDVKNCYNLDKPDISICAMGPTTLSGGICSGVCGFGRSLCEYCSQGTEKDFYSIGNCNYDDLIGPFAMYSVSLPPVAVDPPVTINPPILVVDPPATIEPIQQKCIKYPRFSKMMCPFEIKPVCGVIEKSLCTNEEDIRNGCQKSYDSECFACTSGSISFYEGNCVPPKSFEPLEGNIKCSESDRKRLCSCKSNKSFVCGYNIFKPTTYGGNTEYFRCKCEACKDKHITSISNGLCPHHKSLEPKEYFCKPKDRFKNCEFEDKEVCAVTYYGLQSMTTACYACQSSDVIAVYDKKCPNY